MIRFKNPDAACLRNGFAFIEIILSLLITGMVVSALFFSLSTTINSVSYSHGHVRVLMALKKFFDENLRSCLEGKDEPSAPQSKEKDITITSKKSSVESLSAFKGLENLSMTTLKGSWKLNNSTQEEQLLYLTFQPVKEKK